MISAEMLEKNLRNRWVKLSALISNEITPETKLEDDITTDLALLDLMSSMMDKAPPVFEGQKMFFQKLHNATSALEEKYK